MRQSLGIAIVFLSVIVQCGAQGHCTANVLLHDVAPVIALKAQLEQAKVGQMDEYVPAAVANNLDQLWDALRHVSDVAATCAKPSINPAELQKQLAVVLHANAPEPPSGIVISNGDHRYDELLGSYGHNLRVQVARPSDVAGILSIQYSINIECGTDNLLLVYALENNGWVERLRWQSPLLKTISDAFGDFFLSGFLRSSSHANGGTRWRVVVAHGTPWCTSRFSGFDIDLLSPGLVPASPHVLWHIARGYSRGEFEPRLKSSGNTFELRLNADCMDFDPTNCLERRVIYRYAVDDDDQVQRLNPLALNARCFVEEWLSAPWSESRELSAAGSVASLENVHSGFGTPPEHDDSQFITHSLGPVRACAAPGVFQVQIDSLLQRFVPGKPGESSKLLPSNYFRVREVKNGYLMLSASTEPDATCTGPNLMPASNK